VSPLPEGDVHRPVLVRVMRSRHRGFSYYVCSCGQEPREPPQRISHRDAWFQAHRESVGLTHVHGVSEAVYGPGYPAEGQTWAQWSRANPGVNPFTGEIHPASTT
jgi:hypothetical protein